MSSLMPLAVAPPATSQLHPETAAAEQRAWQQLLDAGAIPKRLPPPPAEVTAIRDANAALFRRLSRRQRSQ